MLTLSADTLKTLLPMPRVIALVSEAMQQVSSGQATLPLRHAMPLDGPNMLGIMPGALQNPACFGTKLISLFPDNPRHGHSSHLGLMVLFERTFGQPIAIMDAGLLTALRTAAASAVATRLLARPDAKTLAIIGTGEQAAFHIQALLNVRPFTSILIAGSSFEKAQAFAQKMQSQHKQIHITASPSAESAVRSADTICTVTSARTPILKGAWLQKGTHINAVGASAPTLQEIDQDTVTKSALFVDYHPSALNQAADIINSIKAGVIDESHIKAEIGAVLAGRATGRTSAQEITLYRSLGVAAQDLICAHSAYTQAKAEGLGQEVSVF